MKKLKIKGITNSNDSYWFRFEPNMNTLERLNEIFNLNPECSFLEKGISYNNALGKEGKHYLIESKNCNVYIILTEHSIHLILRKMKNFESVKTTILENFEMKNKFKK